MECFTISSQDTKQGKISSSITNAIYRTQALEFTLIESLLIGSLLCSSDVIAAISIIKYEEQPKLFSIIFGEGIVNDAVAIILYQTMITFTIPGAAFGPATAFQILGEFLLLTVCSILIGITYGLVASLIIKYFRFVTVSSIKETLIIFSFGYLAYCTGEVFHFSGIIAMLTSGIVMAHYAWYSLSPQGKTVSSVTIQSIGFGFEAFVFAYLGLSFFSYWEYEWSWEFILMEIVVILVGRFIGTAGLIYFISLFGHKRDVSFR